MGDEMEWLKLVSLFKKIIEPQGEGLMLTLTLNSRNSLTLLTPLSSPTEKERRKEIERRIEIERKMKRSLPVEPSSLRKCSIERP